MKLSQCDIQPLLILCALSMFGLCLGARLCHNFWYRFLFTPDFLDIHGVMGLLQYFACLTPREVSCLVVLLKLIWTTPQQATLDRFEVSCNLGLFYNIIVIYWGLSWDHCALQCHLLRFSFWLWQILRWQRLLARREVNRKGMHSGQNLVKVCCLWAP